MPIESQEFARFGDLPVEIQLQIWEIALENVRYLRASWSRPSFAIAGLMVEIPELGDDDLPGLIPCSLPPGMPRTLESHPLYSGWPTGHGPRVEWEDYEEQMLGTSTPRPGVLSSLKKVFGQRTSSGGPETHQSPILGALACFSVCRVSRQVALAKCIVDTGRPIPGNALSLPSSPPLLTLGHGAVIRSIFRDNMTGELGPVFLWGQDATRRSAEISPAQPDDPLLAPSTHVATRLSDIERCIFGHRISLTKLDESLQRGDGDLFRELGHSMWWAPELGARARRPEANHPFHMAPYSVMCVYAAVLHQIALGSQDEGSEKRACPEIGESVDYIYEDGSWYLHLIKTGHCARCHRPLVQNLQKHFPDLLNEKGHMSVVIAMSRRRYEHPQRTTDFRSDENVFTVGIF